MNWMLPIELKKQVAPIGYQDKLLLVGSCFTEHIGRALSDLKFSILQNPNGILFGPDAVCKSLLACSENREYAAKDLFFLNEVWNSWQHHSRFSHVNRDEAVLNINASIQEAHNFLQTAQWLIITLGSAFTYRLTGEADLASEQTGEGVANCHRAPSAWFKKELLPTDSITRMLEHCIGELRKSNPGLKFLFTISPVRHIRDGVVENNRSKARLIEAVHDLTGRLAEVFYFPAYELVIDVLRDYRFYDIDLVHPNYAATEYVMEKFTDTCMDEATREIMKEVIPLVTARRHKAFQPETNAHQRFLAANLEKAKQLQDRFPFLDLSEEISYFSHSAGTRGQ
ncbi:MAG: GSCFA domain-containing protein [Chitinophagaceae bacterium]